jgi:hypothetical protein
MGTVRATQRLDLDAIRQYLTTTNGPVMREMLRRGLLVETAAKRNLQGNAGHPKRIDSGRLWLSIHTSVVQVGGEPQVRVGTNVYYARWIHNGTGIYGPRHARIVPKRARRLRFRLRGGPYVFRASVAGIRPNHFLVDALVAARG